MFYQEVINSFYFYYLFIYFNFNLKFFYFYFIRNNKKESISNCTIECTGGSIAVSESTFITKDKFGNNFHNKSRINDDEIVEKDDSDLNL